MLGAMPLYMDHHKNLEGLTAQAVAADHKKDLEVQHKHDAKALKYWFNEDKGEVYCLFEAPNAEAAEAVHREAHGRLSGRIAGAYSGRSADSRCRRPGGPIRRHGCRAGRWWRARRWLSRRTASTAIPSRCQARSPSRSSPAATS